MYDHMDGVMRALAKNKTKWKEDLYFAVKTTYTTQYQEAFLKYVENEYCAKHRRLLVTQPESIPINNLVSSAMASRSGQSSYDPYDLSTDDGEYIMPNNVTETTPGWSDRAARLLTAARLHLNSPPELPQNRGQIHPILTDYHSDEMEISSTFWLPDITDWCQQQEELHSKYTNLSNVARDIFSIIPHGVRVEASSTLGRDVIRWWQSNTTGGTLCKMVVVRQFARANHGLLAGYDPVLNPTSTDKDMEMRREAEQKKLHRMGQGHDMSEMWQGSQNPPATQQESGAQNMIMTAIGFISDTEEIVKASWSFFQHDGAAAFKLSETSPVPPALSAMDLPGGRTQALNVRQITRIDRHPAKSNEDSSPDTTSDTNN